MNFYGGRSTSVSLLSLGRLTSRFRLLLTRERVGYYIPHPSHWWLQNPPLDCCSDGFLFITVFIAVIINRQFSLSFSREVKFERRAQVPYIVIYVDTLIVSKVLTVR